MRFFVGSRVGIAACALVILGVAVFSTVTDPHGGMSPTLLAVMVVQAAALVVRPTAPVPVWIICLAGYIAVGVAGEWAGGAAAMCQVALLNLALARGGRPLAVAAVITFLVVYAVVLSYEPPGSLPGIGFTMIAWTIGAAGFGVALRARRDQVAAAEDRARWAVETREAEAQRRVAEERLRIARDLHDVLGHHVAVIRLHTGLARRSVRTDPDRAETALREAESAGQAVLREMAGMLQVLREPGQGDTAGPAPGLADLDPLVATLRSGGMDVTVERDGDPGRVPDLVGLTAYRVVQELLTNARRHGSGPVTLAVRVTGDAVVIRSSNPASVDGRLATSGHGLIGMRERVRATGGHLEILEGDGTFTVCATLPLQPEGATPR
ncbi:sensor histidine kinase [Actinoplanes rectilineatus]|uniref:sensor histidine kinase n=1 Tax=Actinoplanes rectilineatus TaxID=113571 RepID=UPI000A633875|nr:histidine kinase [Actinoplanes rectilineatus]